MIWDDREARIMLFEMNLGINQAFGILRVDQCNRNVYFWKPKRGLI
jgi:hypothetical protein